MCLEQLRAALDWLMAFFAFFFSKSSSTGQPANRQQTIKPLADLVSVTQLNVGGGEEEKEKKKIYASLFNKKFTKQFTGKIK